METGNLTGILLVVNLENMWLSDPRITENLVMPTSVPKVLSTEGTDLDLQSNHEEK
jgi:hypothetical protein